MLLATLVSLVAALVASAQAPRRAAVPCARLGRPDREGRFLAAVDRSPPTLPVDGDDLLALVNRSPRWRLSPSYAPRDLVDLRTLRPLPAWQCVPPQHQCLRVEAARAFRDLSAALARAGEHAWIGSAFRSYGVQCSVFAMWAYERNMGFCAASAASALPGHSQHQLGTAIDLFTVSWVRGGPRFREGFGCSRGGRWLAEHAWEFGFVLPYPLHPDYRAPGSDCAPRPGASGLIDPRTGYKHEPWHLRYIGRENAARFRAAYQASGPGGPGEITLEQWLRARAGLVDPVEPPVCDGCTCSSCATFASGRGTGEPCAGSALALDQNGMPQPPASDPAIVDARAERGPGGVLIVRVRVDVPANTLTQPPVVTPASGLRYARGTSFEHIAAVPGGAVRAYPPLPGAWRIAVGLEGERALAWRAALVEPDREGLWNGINARLPAARGRIEVAIPVEGIAQGASLRVALVREEQAVDERLVRVP